MKPNHFALICRQLIEKPGASQRSLAAGSKLSLGLVNAVIQECLTTGYLKQESGRKLVLTPLGQQYLDQFRVENAIILAAGFGSRCVPLTYETPKGLLRVNGKPMLEQQIEQLKEKGVQEIIIVVGYMKEKFDYLIDKFGVRLIFNPEFATKNNFASLFYARQFLKSSYVLMADSWIENNIFNTYEPESWIACAEFEGQTQEWCVDLLPSGRIRSIEIGGSDSLAIFGPAYFSPAFSEKFREYLSEYYRRSDTADYYWEHILKDKLKHLPIYANNQTGNVYEFENLEELRQYDATYLNDTRSLMMEHIALHLKTSQQQITDIVPLKKGVTNQSFRFSAGDKQYIFRLPGTGAQRLINHANEKQVYEAIRPMDIADEVVSFDVQSGIKISKYYRDVRIADPFDDNDLKQCMQLIRRVHDKRFKVGHAFDIASMIKHYVGLAEDIDAIRFPDIEETKQKMRALLELHRQLDVQESLCHGDCTHANVLLPDNKHDAGCVARLIDWEYSGMADPVMDISTFAITAQFDRERMELCFRLYKGGEPSVQEWARFYLYVALCGFLWCMWGQYRQKLDGVEFGEYPLKMYRYMKDYCHLAMEMMGN